MYLYKYIYIYTFTFVIFAMAPLRFAMRLVAQDAEDAPVFFLGQDAEPLAVAVNADERVVNSG